MEIVKKVQHDTSFDTIIIPFTKSLELEVSITENLRTPVAAIIKSGLFKGEESEIYKLSFLSEDKILSIVMLGLGEEDNRAIFMAFSKAFSVCKELNAKVIRVLLENSKVYINDYDVLEKICESALLSIYEFNNYKSDAKMNTVERVEFQTSFDGFDRALGPACFTIS